jgi:hypothetical protein
MTVTKESIMVLYNSRLSRSTHTLVWRGRCRAETSNKLDADADNLWRVRVIHFLLTFY